MFFSVMAGLTLVVVMVGLMLVVVMAGLMLVVVMAGLTRHPQMSVNCYFSIIMKTIINVAHGMAGQARHDKEHLTHRHPQIVKI